VLYIKAGVASMAGAWFIVAGAASVAGARFIRIATNANCNSETMKLAYFDEQRNKSTKTIPTMLYLQTNSIRDYYWP